MVQVKANLTLQADIVILAVWMNIYVQQHHRSMEYEVDLVSLERGKSLDLDLFMTLFPLLLEVNFPL